MQARCCFCLGFLLLAQGLIAEEPAIQTTGRLTSSDPQIVLWWALSSAAKIQPQQPPPDSPSPAVQIRCAANETESVQVVIRPDKPLRQLTIRSGSFAGPGGEAVSSNAVEILQALYLNVTTPTDRSTRAGLWPDPLPPLAKPVDLEPGTNYSFWVRLHVPRSAAPGPYRAALRLRAQAWEAEVPLELTVYRFALPDTLSCQTAFGFSPGDVFAYHHLQSAEDKRAVLKKYLANLSAHHISPYDPAPLDPIQVTWPDVHPPKEPWDQWENLRVVTNEFHSGRSALLLYDDKSDQNVVVSYTRAIPIPAKGLRLRGWYRTAIPGYSFGVALNHFDAQDQWMSGRNNDLVLEGNGLWQSFDYHITEFPAGAKSVHLKLLATAWTDAGEKTGLVWLDDLSLQDAETGAELVQGGDFERRPRTELCLPAERLQPAFDFQAWDRAMTEAIQVYHFNSFSVPIPGLGGGTFHELFQPSLQGFAEDTPEYPLLLGSYCRQIEAHLRDKGWLPQAFVYWFDEPTRNQYPFLQKGFAKLKQYCPDLTRMITKHVEPGLVGGPNLWCPISHEYNHERAEERRRAGERFWWYVCTGPKAPYTGLFLDHPAPELRIWLWQTFQRNIQGILVWQCNYWNSPTAYPDPPHQNPYADPMSWMTGYGTPAGRKSPWGNGDGRFIYPPLAAVSGDTQAPVIDGPVDSIRWEHLRDGLEDYEYLTLLRRALDQRRAALAPETLSAYEALLTVPDTITRSLTEFARDGAPLELRRHQVARAIEALSR